MDYLVLIRKGIEMKLNKQKGQMYTHITHTANPITGSCIHKCSYCYAQKYTSGNLKFKEYDLSGTIRPGKFIFIGSMTDLFASNVPNDWIEKILDYLGDNPGNKYLFQSKNPIRFLDFSVNFPELSVICTTIESNREYHKISQAPLNMYERAECIREMGIRGFETQITIEPILDFDLDEFVDLLRYVNPEIIVIGADSKGHNLPEPSAMKVKRLIAALQSDFRVIIKDNLERLLI